MSSLIDQGQLFYRKDPKLTVEDLGPLDLAT